eukprot:scaffold193172_cov36-Cyclotella_meneghiniana.AAC.1
MDIKHCMHVIEDVWVNIQLNMYKHYDENASHRKGGNYKKAKRNYNHTVDDEDPNQHMVLQALSASICCNPHHVQFGSYKANEINKSCQGTIVMPNVKNGVVDGRKVIN